VFVEPLGEPGNGPDLFEEGQPLSHCLDRKLAVIG
jgi:hypothetical protein